MTPFEVKDKLTGQGKGVPCGKCPACCARRTSAWSFRLRQEEKVSSSSIFLTLTYDTSNVPITPKGFMSLEKKDLQDFFKKLRKAVEKADSTLPPIRYYAVGEYGGKTKRPHYHVILFNGHLPSMQPTWGNGECHYGTVTGASIGYTLKYISKKSQIPAFDGDDRKPEFALMSKGLGKNYINSQTVKWHHSNLQTRMYCVTEDGKKISMPRYYKEKIYHENERKAIGAEARIKKLVQQETEEAQANPITPDQRFQGAKAAFLRMEIDSTKLDKL